MHFLKSRPEEKQVKKERNEQERKEISADFLRAMDESVHLLLYVLYRRLHQDPNLQSAANHGVERKENSPLNYGNAF